MTEPGRGSFALPGAGFQSLLEFRNRYFAAGEGTPVIAGAVAVPAIVVGFFVYASHVDPDSWVPPLVAIAVGFLGMIVCSVVAGPRDKRLKRLMVISLLLKLACTVPRYYLNEVFYNGDGDAGLYDEAGLFFVQNLVKGEWSIDGSLLTAYPPQTRIIGYMTGVMYSVFGTSYFGGYLVYAFMGWLGLVLTFKAFRLAYPDASPYLAAKLMFFLPSLMFWPASIGKDAVMVFLIGVLSFGVARLLTGKKWWAGLVWLGGGGYLMFQIRPHLLLICVVALTASTLTKPSGRTPWRGVLARALMLAVLLPALIVGIEQMDRVLGTEAGGSETFEGRLNTTVSNTSIGGSSFETQPVRTPLDIPVAIITVVYRPFLFEASNVPVLVSAIEGSVLLAMTVAASRWIWRIGPAMYRSSFAAFGGAFVLGFVVAFSNIGNAGILARQRVQMFPLLVVVVCAAREHLRVHEESVTMLGEPGDSTPVAPDPELVGVAASPDPTALRLP